jgi:hypothetical protein
MLAIAFVPAAVALHLDVLSPFFDAGSVADLSRSNSPD